MTSSDGLVREGFAEEYPISEGPQILVVDREYLIAMEAERILTDAMLCDVRIAMPHDYAETIEANRFDVVVIDAGVAERGGADTIRRQCQVGTAVVFTALTHDSMERLPDFRGFAIVAKPFVDEDLLSAVKMALRLPELDI